MSEISPNLESETIQARDNLERYSKLVGLSERRDPRSIDELPSEVKLPGGILGDMEQAIFDLDEDGKERSQFVDWDPNVNNFKIDRQGNPAVGDESGTSWGEVLKDSWRAFFGKKALFEYHIHPRKTDWFFSIADLRGYQIYQNLAHPVC